MQLPLEPNISISKLTSVFKSTSATYKFYWFWAILESIEEGNTEINKKEIFARMLTLSWYTVNYFHVSFGKQDQIQDAVRKIKDIENLNVDSKKSVILEKLLMSNNSDTNSTLNHFDKNVPHKFLSPWLGTGSKSEVYNKSIDTKFNAPYVLLKDSIIISDNWLEYFKVNSGILKSFCYWNLTLFLQVRNPNVPDIPNKIQRPIIRGGLNNHKKLFWDLILNELGHINCIYTGEKLVVGGYIIEHFIPHQFVAHDLMWNLIPAESSFNLSKSDKLPDFNTYFDDFYDLQEEGYKIIKALRPKNKFLQDYLPIFPNQEFNKLKYEQLIKPMLTIANNNGFQYMNS
ncbi:HNH endonuclease domain-containing protein [Formosa sp. PL04]|uniref:HNH endonuclease domain-containing protein n=1 Tax=Formosa sp. PL04 TaxID=3081755 RepID=UPI0029829501|nr:HNH endonuclease domain-containing protein [Formosa sp. PL04]MDW5288889.1 HNH endonuclease domain-containing protein [Formosa sp. PL04]